MPVLVGTSGWQYRHWRGTFYPEGVPQSRWLEYYCERFDTVELNNPFYRLPKPEMFATWRDRVPADFVIVTKMNRFVTHIRRLRDIEEPIERFLTAARHLEPKLGPVLFQFPPNLKADLDGLRTTLDVWPDEVPAAFEFRHETWFQEEEVRRLLARKNAALCWADRRAKPVTALWRTADWGYVRLHEGRGRPHPCYTRPSMVPWAERIAHTWGPDADVYVFFNNDPRACALRDAIVFAELVEDVGLEPTRVPNRRDVKVGGEETQAWATSS